MQSIRELMFSLLFLEKSEVTELIDWPLLFSRVTDYLFIYDVFNGAVNNSDYIMTNESMISDQWIEKDMEGSGCALFKVLS